MKRIVVLAFALAVALGVSVSALAQAAPPKPGAGTAQAPPAQPPAGQLPAGQPPAAPKPAPKPAPKARAATPARLSLMLFVSDRTGAPVPGAQVTLEGPTPREGVTSREGTVRFQGLRAGEYRVRLEAEGFVAFEKELAVRAGTGEVELSLTRAPAPAKPPEPEPAAKPQPSAATAIAPPDPTATVEVTSVVDWLAKNRLDRGEPRKEGVVARAPNETATVLQVRDALRDRSHLDADEVIYVINGSASLSSKGRVVPLETGSLILIPRGVTFTIENRGREPLWALSVMGPGGQAAAQK